MVTVKGRSSDILNELFGDTSEYSNSISLYGSALDKKYPDKQLSNFFFNLGNRTVTILPMAFCQAFCMDLGVHIDSKTLAAIGLSCVIVAGHDDVVDETPSDQKTLASLVYGADITNLHALKELFNSTNPLVINTLIDALMKDHYLQTLVIDKLWKEESISNEQYFDAVKHWCTFCSIGPLCALATADKMNLKNNILEFSNYYGIAFQLLDDLREVDEDKERGYKSIPRKEGFPYKETFKLMRDNLKLARIQIKKEWQKVNSLLDNIENVVSILEGEIRGA